MNCLKNKHIYFVPNKAVDKPLKDNNVIFVFSSRQNGKNYKKKRFDIGIIVLNNKDNNWYFISAQEHMFPYDTLMIIAQMLHGLNSGNIIYNLEKGMEMRIQ